MSSKITSSILSEWPYLQEHLKVSRFIIVPDFGFFAYTEL